MHRSVYFSLVCGLSLALVTTAQAFDLFSPKVELPAVPAQLQEVREFVQKNESCVLSVAQVPKDGKINDYTVLAWKKQLRCIADRKPKGGLDDPSGCMYAFFDAGKKVYTPVENMTTFGHGTFIFAKDKACDAGGFEELLKMKIGYYGMTVQKDLMSVIKGNTLIPVTAASKKYIDWFNTNQMK